MKKLLIIIIPIMLLATAAVPAYLVFTNKIRIQPPVLYSVKARITFALGKVEVKKSPNAKWEKGKVGLQLEENAVVRTGRLSTVDLIFNNYVGLRMTENSRLVVKTNDINNKKIVLEKGKLYGRFKREHQEQRITIEMPTAVASVRGTELGFEIIEIEKEDEEITSEEDNKKSSKKKKKKKHEDVVSTIPAAMIYSVSGIVEVSNPLMRESNLLLSYQTSSLISQNRPPRNPKKITPEKNSQIQKILNGIHMEDVLFISDKILFDYGKSQIKRKSYKELKKIVNLLKERSAKIRIEGHTDNRGNAHFNQKLSKKRALAIKEYLVTKGISGNRLFVKGHGSSRPIASNTTKEGQQKNRRVEFIIIE